jgi:hypothetical protein
MRYNASFRAFGSGRAFNQDEENVAANMTASGFVAVCFFAGVNFIAASPYDLLSRPENETNWMDEVTEVGTRACQIPYGHAELYRQRQRLRYRAACPGSTSTRGETL